MIIEMTEKFTQAEIDEIFEITLRRSQLYKDPAKKMKGSFYEGYKGLITGSVLLTITSLLGLITKFNVLSIISMTLSGVMIFIGILWLIILKKTYKDSKSALEKTEHSKMIIEEESIAVEMDNGTTVKIKWTEVEFIRVFKQCAAIFSSDKSRALIVPLKHWDPIAKFMEDNRILVKFIR